MPTITAYAAMRKADAYPRAIFAHAQDAAWYAAQRNTVDSETTYTVYPWQVDQDTFDDEGE